MKIIAHLLLALAAGLSAVGSLGTSPADAPQDPSPTRYVCPPCGVDCHEAVFDAPGACPACGMTLVDRKTVPQIALLLLESVDLLSATGPAGVLAAADVGRVLSVSDSLDPIRADGVLSLAAVTSFADAPPVDVLIVPELGDFPDLIDDELVMEWVRSAAGDARYVLAVGTGAALVARAGLLDGGEVPGNAYFAKFMAEVAPEVSVVEEAARTEHGKVIVARDAAAAIDAALEIALRLKDGTALDRVARRTGFVRGGEGH